MAASPFSFFRGALPIMAYDLSLTPHTIIVNQICGDAHVQNLGAYAGEDGRLIFDINDFDETTRAPFEWDIKRLATSILLAGEQGGVRSGARSTAVSAFLREYSTLIVTLSQLPVMEVARYKVHGIGSAQPISDILRKAERSNPLHSMEQLLEPKTTRFRSEPPVLRRVMGAERRAVLAALPMYRESLAPERQHFFDQFRPIDVAFKVVGTGSVGLRDYCIFMEGNGPGDPLFLQIKQEHASAFAPYLPVPRKRLRSELHQGQRVVNGQRSMQFQSDPLLGWTSISGEEYLVRQLNDHKATLDVTTLDAVGLTEYAEVCGRILAHGHARSGDAQRIAGYIGKGKAFCSAISEFAEAYADQSVADWKLLKQRQKKK
ncbi:DUF2252 domain-containing protein [Granulicella cerasi]|uniref:DUF2252 domain-containing protein n=2 Tax=Granulicella cerasi TaxID=741063 RepID=A0ABW1Z897_9BACT